LPIPRVTVAVPTLAEGDALAGCLRSLESQTLTDFEVIVVDNSGAGRVQAPSWKNGPSRLRVIANARNVGYGTAINQVFHVSRAEYLAALNDDAVADPRWLEALIESADAHPKAGLFASQVRLCPTALDSAGMLIAADGSSKQRGHGDPPQKFGQETEALLPSGSAAMFRREMLEQIGLFDESFFLYCEDTDLGLRARWAGWECVYVPGAMVEHRYSHSAGKASLLKAYYVERNRLFTVIKNFPFVSLLGVPFAALARYFWHFVSLFQGHGKAAEFREERSPIWLPFLVLRAHLAAALHLPRLIRHRRRIMAKRRICPAEFKRLLAQHAIPVRRVAAL
jgi:GT2 family glycosyltransferase